MKRTKLSVLSVFALVALVFFSGACRETGSISTKRAQLIANENMELKKQAESLKQEINKQKELLAKCEKEMLKIPAESAKTHKLLFDTIGKIGRELEDKATENEELKQKIAELEAKLAQKTE